jgi:hypothetical protein
MNGSASSLPVCALFQADLHHATPPAIIIVDRRPA